MNEALRQRFSEEVFRHYGIIHKVCRIYKKDPADREDLLQEILYNAWRSYPRFEGRSMFSTWLYRVALNTALYHNRKERLNVPRVPIEDKVLDIAVQEVDERMKILYQAIDELNPLEKSIVILFLDDQPYAEIAEVTGLSISNVGAKLTRIRAKMKEIISAYGT